MDQFKISDKCKVNTNQEKDTFVGIECNNGSLSFNFPLGYSIPENEDELRSDILLILNSIAITVGKRDSELQFAVGEMITEGFPLHAFLYVIYDFYEHGYYKEKNTLYTENKRGKIHWGKTIKTQKPYFNNGNIIYLNFITRKNSIQENELITQIHKYCVYESFLKMGWLFTSKLPEKPEIIFNQKLFRSVINDKLDQTFNDEVRRLLKNMLDIVDNTASDETNTVFKYGTNRFEYVWEKAIDRAFGIKNKRDYFPKTYWEISGRLYENSSLEPDTIMIYKNNVYILDAKYYKFGITKKPTDLPESSSINKQITYGEYVDQTKFYNMHGEKIKIYNAFLMPYISESNPYSNCGIAYSDWKQRNKEYEDIQGILVDLKHLLKLSAMNNQSEIYMLAETIVKSIKSQKI